MAAPALAPRAQVSTASRNKVQMKFERGECPKCHSPMLVDPQQPKLPCFDCVGK